MRPMPWSRSWVVVELKLKILFAALGSGTNLLSKSAEMGLNADVGIGFEPVGPKHCTKVSPGAVQPGMVMVDGMTLLDGVKLGLPFRGLSPEKSPMRSAAEGTILPLPPS